MFRENEELFGLLTCLLLLLRVIDNLYNQLRKPAEIAVKHDAAAAFVL